MILYFLFGLLGIIFSTAVLVIFLRWFDRYEKEPIPLLAFAFFWGLIPAVVFSIILEIIFSQPLQLNGKSDLAQSFFSVSVIAPIVEEFVKGIFLFLLFLFFRKNIDDELDGAIYGAMSGFGFALTEDVLYFIKTLENGIAQGYFNVFLRSFLFGSNHAFWTSIIGFAWGWALLSRNKIKGFLVVLTSWFAAVFLHSLHNTCTILVPHTYCLSIFVDFFFNFGGLVLLLVVLTLIHKKEGKRIEKYLSPEVSSGLISKENLSMIISTYRRSSARLKALKNGGKKENKKLGEFLQTASELSFKRFRAENGSDKKLVTQISELAKKFASLAPEVKKWLVK
ncbi:PrsW family intramembrane metalloprotease [candidate division WOR-3 bacterium]|nr:PrsW family intramembrane metalloprotease [candidate division WOR-3 bacterium]